MKPLNKVFSLFVLLCLWQCLQAQVPALVSEGKDDAFVLALKGTSISLLADDREDAGVLRAVTQLQHDFSKVTGTVPVRLSKPEGKRLLIIGTVTHSRFITQLIEAGKLNGAQLQGKYEKYLLQTVANPLPGVDEALVIAGSDKRGAIYGIYELSAQIGVSPWYYWADVPVKKQENLYIKRGIYTDGEPRVKYRGIFLNDEAPALSGWSRKTFGGFNSQFYEKVFELILRLKGNFLWPAMWGSAFYDDDARNGALAHEMGIVIGTSHHEPLGRAHDEWRRYGSGKWDYKTNSKTLTDFWKGGMNRMKEWEAVVTVGMRGDGDEPMSEGANIALLEKIVKDQRAIIADVTGKKPSETPQMWALYKEVQDYYDKGMRVPDDITLMLCDDNWGNVRKLPELDAKPRKGGYGMYYHFDYVGGPRNYKWLNVSPIQRIWEQMNLAYRYGVKNSWIVNVGDLKPMEYPIQFFLDMAWDPDRFNQHNLLRHTEDFCARQFGTAYAKEIARLIDLYAKYNRRVTPELLNEKTYSLHHYNEFQRVVDDYRALLLDAMKLNYLLLPETRDAYDQLVLFPIHACANLYEMYYAVAMNHHLAAIGDVKANTWADKAKEYYKRDSLLTHHYNKEMVGGKWEHMMDQTHIGYSSWQQPEQNQMPQVVRIPENYSLPESPVFMEKEGAVSMEAAHYTKAVNGRSTTWIIVPGLGKIGSAVTTTPVTETPDETMQLEYAFESSFTGEVRVEVLVSPTLNFNDNRGLSYAVSIDGGKEQIVNINKEYDNRLMEQWQATSINRTVTRHTLAIPGRHLLRFRPLNPGIVLQKIMLDMGGLKPSYLGAPETSLASAPRREAKLKLPALVSDGMVLQHGHPVNVWGTAEPGKIVIVSFLKNSIQTVTDPQGNWQVTLPAMKPGGPYAMTVNELQLKNILVGDVWLCSGQSNMELPISRVLDLFKAETEADANPMIRHVKVPLTYNFHAPQQDVPATAWKELTPQNALSFSALAYFFAKEWYAKTNIPVGLINSTVGGSPVEAWMSEEGLKEFPRCRNDKQMYESDAYVDEVKQLDARRQSAWNTALYRSDAGLHESPTWYAANYNDSDWQTTDLLATAWGSDGLNPLNGSHWFRREFEVPQLLAEKEAVLRMGCIVDADSVFVNGTFVGSVSYQYPPRIYPLPANLLRAGTNQITVRLISYGGYPQFVSDKPYQLVFGNEELPLGGVWKYKQGCTMPSLPGQTFFQYKPEGLYNAMIAPLLAYTTAGIIWYQGESNVARHNEYAPLLTALVKDWRTKMQRPNLPFYVVELASFLAPQDSGQPAWAALRKAQAAVAANDERVTLIPNSDLGEWNDIHPLDKKTLGKRVATAVWLQMKTNY